MGRWMLVLFLLCVFFSASAVETSTSGEASTTPRRSVHNTSADPHVAHATNGVDDGTGGGRTSSSAPPPTSHATPVKDSTTPLAIPTMPGSDTSPPFVPHQPRPPPHPITPPPAPTDMPAPSARPKHRQSTVAIVFEVLAGVAGLVIVLLLLRCANSWRRTPSRDRVAALVNRHQLQREMEELEREQIQRRMPGAVYVPPPPPYQQAPAYDCVEPRAGSASEPDQVPVSR